MKCIKCGEKAEYMYLGNSYCQKHKDEHKNLIDALLKKEREVK